MTNKSLLVPQNVGNRIRLARQQRGLSQKDLASLIGVTAVQIHRYERGLTKVSLERLEYIANNLDLPLSFFRDSVLTSLPNPSKIKRLLVNFRKIPQTDIRKRLLDLVEELARTLQGRLPK